MGISDEPIKEFVVGGKYFQLTCHALADGYEVIFGDDLFKALTGNYLA